MTVTELLQRTTSRELTEWMLYERVEPFGERGAYLRAGIVAATIVNAQSGRSGEPAQPDDFMPETLTFGPRRKDDEPMDIADLAKLLGARKVDSRG